MQGWGGMIGAAIEGMALAVRVVFVVIVLLASALLFSVAWFFWGAQVGLLSVAAVLLAALVFIAWVTC